MPARDEAAVVSPVEDEAESPSRGAMSPASPRQSAPSQDNMVATSAGSEDVESLSGDASPGLDSHPRRRSNREGRLKRCVSTYSRVAAREQVRGDYASLLASSGIGPYLTLIIVLQKKHKVVFNSDEDRIERSATELVGDTDLGVSSPVEGDEPDGQTL